MYKAGALGQRVRVLGVPLRGPRRPGQPHTGDQRVPFQFFSKK